MLVSLLRDESGFVFSSELLIIATLMICGAVVGFASIRDSLILELHDVSEAIGAVSQSYSITGIKKSRSDGGVHGRCSGFGYNDDADDCDCFGISFANVAGKNDPSASGVRDGT